MGKLGTDEEFRPAARAPQPAGTTAAQQFRRGHGAASARPNRPHCVGTIARAAPLRSFVILRTHCAR
ncbi:hypothetical protein BCEN4_20037 [Burkholderia cenocepacia]|nr:hypothetical protein BCEN4_20037 [Burkholderia cenocepacia]